MYVSDFRISIKLYLYCRHCAPGGTATMVRAEGDDDSPQATTFPQLCSLIIFSRFQGQLRHRETIFLWWFDMIWYYVSPIWSWSHKIVVAFVAQLHRTWLTVKHDDTHENLRPSCVWAIVVRLFCPGRLQFNRSLVRLRSFDNLVHTQCTTQLCIIQYYSYKLIYIKYIIYYCYIIWYYLFVICCTFLNLRYSGGFARAHHKHTQEGEKWSGTHDILLPNELLGCGDLMATAR